MQSVVGKLFQWWMKQRQKSPEQHLKPKGRLRVLSMGSFGHHYVFPVMAEFCKHYPELTVEYTTSQYVPDLLAKRGGCQSLSH